MEQNYELKGNCACGEVKYKITEKPLFTQACHCKDCKVLTGSSYVVNSSVLENSFFLIERLMSLIPRVCFWRVSNSSFVPPSFINLTPLMGLFPKTLKIFYLSM